MPYPVEPYRSDPGHVEVESGPVEVDAAAIALAVDTLLSANHGAGAWTGGGSAGYVVGSGGAGTIPSLPAVVQGATHTPLLLTWRDASGEPVDLTGATITGRLRLSRGGTVRDAEGAFPITDHEAGAFQWLLAAADVAEDGDHLVQFTATYADDTEDRTVAAVLPVKPAL
ncbi:MAG: hypothetical protein H6637_05395 [Ardenticatenales bacterium]|nr:hypothetical protein [Ardenticatenales bacterium]